MKKEKFVPDISKLDPCPWCKKRVSFLHGKVKCMNFACKVMPKSQGWYTNDKIGFDVALRDWNYK